MQDRTAKALILGVLIWSWAAAGAAADDITLRVVGWNLESGESDATLLRSQMAAKSGVHLWGLSEVPAGQISQFESGAEDGENSDFGVVLGTTGGNDRLAALFDQARLELLGHQELGMIQLSSGLRAPLVVRFRGKRSGQEFLFLVNHLKRGGAQNAQRIEQARRLNQWARAQALPIIAVGDYNFDYDVERGDQGVPFRDQGFDELTRDGVFLWIRPERLVKTNADEDFNTVLDFAFAAHAPFGWSATSRILERGGDEEAVENPFPDSNAESDHRPVEAVFVLGQGVPDGPGGAEGGGPGAGASRAALLARIERLESELRSLRAEVERLND